MSPSHEHLSRWYHQLAQQLEAGRPLAEALRTSHGNGRINAVAGAMADAIEQGGSVDEALGIARGALPEADTLFLSAAAETGRLPRILQTLSARHEQFRTLKLRLIFACAYPAAVLHVGLLLFPLRQMISGENGLVWDSAVYLRGLSWTLLPLWASVGLIAAIAGRRTEWLRCLGRAVPLVRGYLRAQALADFAQALANFLDAGLAIQRAWPLAGLLSRTPDLNEAAQKITTAITRGELPGPRMREYACFPADFAARYQVGEATGHLEENLFRLARDYQEQADRKLKSVSVIYPTGLLVVVGGLTIFQVVSFYAGYLKVLSELGGP